MQFYKMIAFIFIHLQFYITILTLGWPIGRGTNLEERKSKNFENLTLYKKIMEKRIVSQTHYTQE